VRGLGLDGEALAWDVDATREAGGECVAEPGFLDGFLELAGGEGEAVLDYAERFGGVLAFCRHGVPGGTRHLDDEAGSWCEPAGRESVEAWLRWSRLARSLVAVADALGTGGRVPGGLWPEVLPFAFYGARAIVDPWPGLDELRVPRRADARRALVAQALSYWLEAGGVRVGVEWLGKRPRFVMGSGAVPDAGILGALGVELVMRCAASERLEECAGCSRPFPLSAPQRARLERDPSARMFCEECREAKVPQRLAMRDRRARLRAAGGK
jgi:hypothetical protein